MKIIYSFLALLFPLLTLGQGMPFTVTVNADGVTGAIVEVNQVVTNTCMDGLGTFGTHSFPVTNSGYQSFSVTLSASDIQYELKLIGCLGPQGSVSISGSWVNTSIIWWGGGPHCDASTNFSTYDHCSDWMNMGWVSTYGGSANIVGSAGACQPAVFERSFSETTVFGGGNWGQQVEFSGGTVNSIISSSGSVTTYSMTWGPGTNSYSVCYANGYVGCAEGGIVQTVNSGNPPPNNGTVTANFGSVVNGNVVSFSDSSTNATYLEWDFDDGSLSHLPNPVHTYDTGGPFQVCLFACDTGGSDTACAPFDPFQCAGNSTFFPTLSGYNIQVEMSDSINSSNPIWSFGDGTSASGPASTSHTYTQPGVYEVCLSSVRCIDPVVVCDTFIVGPSLTSLDVLPADTTICPNQTLNLTVGYPGANYLWSTGSTQQTLAVSSGGMYTVTVTNSLDTLVDSILVVPSSTLFGFSIAMDTTICQGDTIQTGYSCIGCTYQWDDGSTQPFEALTGSGVHWLEVTDSLACQLRDSIEVTYNQTLQQVSLNPTGVFCATDSFPLAINDSGLTVLWSDGSTGPGIVANAGGTYWVTGTNACGSASDSIQLTRDTLLVGYLGNDTSICDGDSLLLDISSLGGYSIWWNNGTFAPTLTVVQSGTVVANIANACGTFSDSLDVITQTLPSPGFPPADTMYCQGNLPTWNISLPGPHTYLWQDGSTGPTLTADSLTSTYWVQVTNACGTGSDTINTQQLSGPPVIDLGPDTLLCANDSLSLGQSQIGANFNWSTNDDDDVIWVFQPGVYSVIANNICGSSTDSIEITGIAVPTPSLGPDTAACDGDLLTLDATEPLMTTYVWSTGSTDSAIVGDTAGTYWVAVTNPCGTVSDTLVRTEIPVPQVSLSTDTFCTGDSVILDISQPQVTYLWNDNSTLAQLTVASGGTYWAEASNACGTASDTVHLVEESPLAPYLGPDDTLCLGDTLLLQSANPLPSFLWSDNSTGNQLAITSAGSYWLQSSNVCGVYADTIQIGSDTLPSINWPPVYHLCPGDSFVLDAFVQGATYQWSGGVNTGPSQVVNGPGTYWVQLTGFCGSTADSTEVVGADQYAINDSVSICAGDSFVFPDGTVGGQSMLHTSHFFTLHGCDSTIETYLSVDTVSVSVAVTQTGGAPIGLTATPSSGSLQWYRCDPNFTLLPGETNAYFQAPGPDPDNIFAVVADNDGCRDTSDCFSLDFVGMGDVAEQVALRLYPNPSTGRMTLDGNWPEQVDQDLRVYNSLGQVVWSKRLLSNRFSGPIQIDLSRQSNGVYLIELVGESTMFWRQKVILRR